MSYIYCFLVCPAQLYLIVVLYPSCLLLSFCSMIAVFQPPLSVLLFDFSVVVVVHHSSFLTLFFPLDLSGLWGTVEYFCCSTPAIFFFPDSLLTLDLPLDLLYFQVATQKLFKGSFIILPFFHCLEGDYSLCQISVNKINKWRRCCHLPLKAFPP